MKCSKCGKEFKGNFCPFCGTPAEKEEKSAETPNQKEKLSSILLGAYDLYWNSRLRFLFMGAFIAAICVFVMGQILSGIALMICGILLTPAVQKKFTNRQKKLTVILTICCAIVAALAFQEKEESSGIPMKSEIAETTDNMTSDYEGIWLTVPSGQGGYTIRAIGVWIKDITDNSVEYELIGFEGSTTSARTEGDYSWTTGTDKTGTTQITASDVSGVDGFGTDEGTVYMDNGVMYIEKYQNDDLKLIKTPFESLDDCIDYYNCDYGYCYNAENSVILYKHGINVHYKDDEYWYLHYKSFVCDKNYLSVKFTKAYGDEGSLDIICYNPDGEALAGWNIKLTYDEKGTDGDFIYHVNQDSYFADGKDQILHFYPKDKHIYIETSDSQVAGTYEYDGDVSLNADDGSVDYGEEVDVDEKNTTEAQEESVVTEPEAAIGSSDSNNDYLWYQNHYSFVHTRVGDTLSVNCMNDSSLFVTFNGVNGDYMEWDLHIEPDQIGDDGELVYYYGKDFVLKYYPDDSHIMIETSNDLLAGEYQEE